MKIMPPDDPTAVYPIGQFDSEELENEATPPTLDNEEPTPVPPIEPEVEETQPARSRGGFNPLIAVAVLAVGGFFALSVLVMTSVILLLIR